MALDTYDCEREELIFKDRSLRRDRHFKYNLTAYELRASEILSKVRRKERKEVWNGGEDGVHLFPGMEFLTAKEIIDRTQLFRIIRKMPKGALLHIHLGAAVNPSTLLKIALHFPQIHICSSDALSSIPSQQSLPNFRAFPTPCTAPTMDICDPNYAPNTWIPLQAARSACRLGTVAFEEWIIRSMTINPKEAYGTHNTVAKIWKKFQDTFTVSEGLLSFYPVAKEYLREFFFSSANDGIMHVEASFNFPRTFHTDCVTEVTKSEFLDMFAKAISEVKTALTSKGKGDSFLGAKIVYSCMRLMSLEELNASLEECLELKQRHPNILAGVTLVGDENALHPLTYYLPVLQSFKEKQKELNIDIPFMFHAGETLGDGDQADENLYDAILLGSKRIGHAFSLPKHPLLIQMCRDRQIAIEVCPISNEVLRLTTSMPMHPLPVLINNGIAVVIGSDDPAVFGNMDLSYDFYQIFVSSDITTLETLKTMARDSIEFSTLNNEQKATALEIWGKEWGTFIEDVLIEEAEK